MSWRERGEVMATQQICLLAEFPLMLQLPCNVSLFGTASSVIKSFPRKREKEEGRVREREREREIDYTGDCTHFQACKHMHVHVLVMCGCYNTVIMLIFFLSP